MLVFAPIGMDDSLCVRSIDEGKNTSTGDSGEDWGTVTVAEAVPAIPSPCCGIVFCSMTSLRLSLLYESWSILKRR